MSQSACSCLQDIPTQALDRKPQKANVILAFADPGVSAALCEARQVVGIKCSVTAMNNFGRLRAKLSVGRREVSSPLCV